MNRELSYSVTNFVPVSDSSMNVQLSGKPLSINIIQTYASTADIPVAELESWYAEIETLLKLVKPHDISIIMGDLCAKIGQGRVGPRK